MGKADQVRETVTQKARQDQMMRSAAHILLFFAFLVSIETTARADFGASYGKGLEALEQELWSEAAEWFRTAIEERPEAGGEVSVSGEERLYVPYYHLGLALYHADAPKEAEEAWRTSAEQGVLLRERPELQQQINVYRPEIEKELRRQRAKEQLERVTRKIRALDEKPGLRAALDADATLRALRLKGIEKLRQARRIYREAGESGDPIALQEVHELAVAAAGILDEVVLSATRLAQRQANE